MDGLEVTPLMPSSLINFCNSPEFIIFRSKKSSHILCPKPRMLFMLLCCIILFNVRQSILYHLQLHCEKEYYLLNKNASSNLVQALSSFQIKIYSNCRHPMVSGNRLLFL